MAAKPLRRGPRSVIWAPEVGLGFGNVLYLWLAAATRQASGEDVRVLAPPGLSFWLERFPELRGLSVSRDAVRPSDQREHLWGSRFGEDFDRSDLHGFITSYLLPGLRSTARQADGLVLNVRRGNYYSEPHFRGTYSFDIPAYVEIALGRVKAEARQQIRVVSDDIDWCRLKLGNLLDARSEKVEYVPPGQPPQAHFDAVATSRCIIGTNSTFSYWGGYISTVLFADSRIVMPRFHARLAPDPSAYQLDPAWDVVHDLPGGWDQ
ncbi:alpha-1,2-fucosyltransferase [Nocardioides litoris]|uniref:alpha-1,2-fucosyltransferase n=1 Tax=Nocardioides litoris TaxID=1926648 RepID=UPI00147693CB|nr:alpha-1,2-fucosyltransferase [Nocardioides litoris]